MLDTLVIGPEDSVLREFLEKAGWVPELRICEHAVQYPSPAELAGLLDHRKPDVVVISLADYERAFRTITRVAAAQPIPIVTLSASCEQRLLLELMQLGVRELWFPPLDVDQMKQAANRLLQQKASLSAASKEDQGALIAFLPARGGSGTTTAAMHTAAALAKLKTPVLLADFDFHNSMIAFWMKLAPRHGFQEALERAHWLDASQWKSMVSLVGDLDLLTSPQASAPLVFSGAETSAVLDYARGNYEFVLVDLPDAIYSSCWEVLEQATRILMVVTPEMAGLYLARRKISHIVDRGIPRDRVKIVLNRCMAMDLQPSEVEKFLSVGVVGQIGNHYRALTAAFSDGKLIDPDSKIGAQYLRLAEQIAGVPARKEEKAGSWKIRQIFSPA